MKKQNKDGKKRRARLNKFEKFIIKSVIFAVVLGSFVCLTDDDHDSEE